MSTDPKTLLDAVPQGSGHALDLGGGAGALKEILEQKGYQYLNAEIQRRKTVASLVLTDAHNLPFKDGVFALVVSNDSLEHFLRPQEVVAEVGRVLATGGQFIIHVPFLQPFHGNDTYRYTPVGLRYLLSDVAGLEIVSLESPLWIFSILSSILTDICNKINLAFLRSPILNIGRIIDSWFTNRRSSPRSFAASYLVIARKR